MGGIYVDPGQAFYRAHPINFRAGFRSPAHGALEGGTPQKKPLFSFILPSPHAAVGDRRSSEGRWENEVREIDSERRGICGKMGGGGGEHGHGHGVTGDFRAKVWSMTGGPYCRPKHWRRNTAIAMFGIVLVCIPIAMKSAELEQRPHHPVHPIPSQLWCKNFGNKEY